MATNVLGSAYIRIVPQLTIGSGITVRLVAQLDDAADAAGRIQEELDDAGDAARRAAGSVEDVEDAAEGAADAAERAADEVEDVGDAARDAEGAADDLRDSLDEAGDAGEQAAERTESRWSGISAQIGQGFSTGIGIVLAQAGAQAAGSFFTAFTSAMESEASADKLAAQLGASGERATELGEIQARVYAANWGESLDQVGEAIRGVTQNIGEGNDEWLERMTTKALALAQTFDQDVGPATAAVAQMLNTGLAGNADEAFDIITAGFQMGADRGGDFLDTIVGGADNLKTFGFDGRAAVGLITQGLDAGAESADSVIGLFEELVGNVASGGDELAEVFTTLGLDARQMTTDLTSGGPAANAALDTLLDSIRNLEDPIQRAAIVAGLFGEEGAAMQNTLMAIDPSSAVAALGEVEGAAGRMADQVGSNAAGSLETLKRTFMTQLGNLGAVALPPLISLATAITGGLEPAFRIAGQVVGGFVVAVGVLGSFLTGTAVPALRDFAGWVSANQTPILIVAGVITAVLLPALIQAGVQATIAAVKQVAAWTMTGAAAVKNAVIQTGALVVSGAKWVWAGWTATGSAAKQVGAWVVIGARATAGAAVQVGALVMTGTRWVWVGIQATVGAARQVAAWMAVGARAAAGVAVQVGALVMTGLRWIWAGATAMANAVLMAAAWLIALGPVGLIIAAVAGVVAVFVILWNECDGFRNFWIAVWNVIKGAALAVWNWIKGNWPLLLSVLTGPIGIAVGLIVKHWDTIKGAISAAFNWVKTNWPLLLAIITGPIGLAVLAVVKNWDTIKNAGIAVWNWIAALPGKIVSALASLGQTIAAPFVTAFNTVNSWILSAVGWFVALPGRIMSAVVSIGTVLVQPFIIGWTAVSSWVTTGVGLFIALPGRLVAALATVWTVLSQPFINGWNIVSSWTNTAMGAIGGIPGRVAGALANIASTVSQPFQNGWTAVSSAITTAVGWFTGLPGRITSALAGVGSAVSGPFKTGFNAVARAWNSGPGAIGFSIPSWVPGLGGKSWSFPDVPLLARGGLITRGGFAITGEHGPELGYWPRGAAVAPLDRAGTLLPGVDPARRGVTVSQTFNVDARGATDPAAFEAAMRRVVDQAEARMLRDLAAMLGQGVGAR